MLLVLSTLLLTPALPIQDWPQFKGPDATAKVPDPGLDLPWGEDGPTQLWNLELGGGYGGPAVRDGRVFLLDRQDESDVLRVIDIENGEEIWSTGYEAPGRLNFPGSRTVPTVTETHVFTAGGFGHVTAFERKSGKIAWQIDMAEDYGGLLPLFGWSSSALLVEDVLIMTVLGEEVGLLAVDPETGEEIWTTEAVGYSHSTPVVIELLGERQLLFLSTTGQGSGRDEAGPMNVSSFDPKTGDLLWKQEISLCRLPIPGPVKVDDERFFLTGGYRAGSKLMRLAREEGTYAMTELFSSTRGAQIHAPILHDQHLFAIVNENWNDARSRQPEGGLVCFDLEGNERWRTADEPFFGRGNLLLAGNHLLIQDGHSGVLRVVKASPEAFTLVAEANPFGTDDRRDHQMWAPMALSGKRLLLRSQDMLLCLEL